MAVLVRWLRA